MIAITEALNQLIEPWLILTFQVGFGIAGEALPKSFSFALKVAAEHIFPGLNFIPARCERYQGNSSDQREDQ